jgi:putative MATE family efflux protein
MNDNNTNSQEPTLELDEKRLPLTVLTLAWPVVLQEATWTIFSMITMIFIGRLGAAAITAVGLSETIVYFPAILIAGLDIGVIAIVARHVGAKEPGQASNIVRQSMLIAFILGIFFAIVLWFSADQLLWIFRARPDVIELGRDYIRVNAPATISVFVLYCSAAILRALGDTKTPMIIMIIVEVLGVSLSYVLITGFWIAPALGVLGAGIGRAVASTVGALVILPILIKGKGSVKYDLRTAWVFDWAETKRILKVGLPAFGDQLAMQGAMNIYTIIISSLGTVIYAAHALAMRVEMFAFMPSWGFGMAAAILVGQSLGAKKPDLAKRTGYLAQRYCMAAMVCLGLITFIFARQLIGIFTDDPEVMKIGTLGLQIWALAMPGMATNQTLAGGLRGAGDTRWVFILNTVSMWTMRVGVGALMAFLFRLGALGAWIGAVLDHSIRAILMWRRFAGGKWQNVEV